MSAEERTGQDSFKGTGERGQRRADAKRVRNWIRKEFEMGLEKR